MDEISVILELIKNHDISKSFLSKQKIKYKLKKIKDQDIINEIGMADMPLIIYLLSLKYDEIPKLVPIENDLMIRVGDCNAANMSYLAIYLHFLNFEQNHLIIEGNGSYPSVLGKCEMGAWFNGQPMKGTLKPMDLDLRKGANIYEIRTAFKLEYDLYDDTEIIFYNEINGIRAAYGRINSMRFAPVADCISGQYYEKDGWVFFIEGRKLVCKKLCETELKEKEQTFRAGIKEYASEKYEWAIKLRDFYLEQRKQRRKPVWLFMDRPDRADDNAKVLFQYVQAKDNLESYFIISQESDDYEEMKMIGKVIPLYSEEHKRLVLIADYIISSQCNGVVENPFWEDAELFRDLYHRPGLIFLQHGVIKDDMSPTLNRFNTNFTGFVTSTKAEYESILDYPYHYTDREVWLTGLPRFDELYNNPGKNILIMPSWRQELMEQVWDENIHNMRWKLKPGFRKSDYYQRYKCLLRNKALMKACKKQGYRLCFMAHPLMKPYVEEMMEGTECELLDSDVSYRDAFAKGALLITDYSSVAFDFAYLQKPVVYYQFDRERFFRKHTYRQGYFDYEKDGLGEVCKSESILVKVILKYMESNCERKPKYSKRMDVLWEYRDGFCERVYNKIITR